MVTQSGGQDSRFALEGLVQSTRFVPRFNRVPLKKRSERSVVVDVKPAAHKGAATVADLGRLYQRQHPRFLRVAEAIVGDPDQAHDVVQDAFARAIRSRFDYRGEGSVEGWVWRTVVNAARNARRDLPPPHVALEDAPDEAVSANGRLPDAHVRALVAALPERQRLVLFLRYYADLDYRQIAEALAIESGTVGATLNHAHAAIRRALEEVPG